MAVELGSAWREREERQVVLRATMSRAEKCFNTTPRAGRCAASCVPPGGHCPESLCWPRRVLWIKWNSVSELGKSLAYVEMVGKSFGLPVPDVALICFVLFVRR